MEDKARELKSKDDLIVEKEKLLQDKLDKVASLQDEISILQVVLTDIFCSKSSQLCTWFVLIILFPLLSFAEEGKNGRRRAGRKGSCSGW